MDKTRITGTTRLYALLGSPVAHSLSPAIHNASFAHLGVDAAYVVFDVDAGQTGAAVAALRTLGIAGFNLTMPCKKAVIEHLDRLSPAAELIGAVNTVNVEADGTLTGHNTDGAGMIRALAEAGAALEGCRLLVLGAGGAARAIIAQAGLDGAAQVLVAKRPGATFAQAADDVARLAAATDTPMGLVDFTDPEAMAEACARADIIINATPIGMGENNPESPLAPERIREGQFVADAVYHPRRTALLASVAEARAMPVEGVGMLLWQGLIAEEIWLADELAARSLAPDPAPILPLLA